MRLAPRQFCDRDRPKKGKLKMVLIFGPKQERKGLHAEYV